MRTGLHAFLCDVIIVLDFHFLIRLIYVIVLKEKKDRKSRSIFAGHFFKKFLASNDTYVLCRNNNENYDLCPDFLFNSAGIDTKLFLILG